MVNSSLLAIFVPTFVAVSATPGMCMTLAMTLGISMGLRKTLWMMLGELAGVALVATAALTGAATIMLSFPPIFLAVRLFGGLYLVYLGMQMWRSRGKMAITLTSDASQPASAKTLIAQGFITAVANPKGWLFFSSLLPPFIDTKYALAPQAAILISIILTLEFVCLLLYASGGHTLKHFLQNSKNVRTMNRIAGILMAGVGGCLVIG